MKLSVAERIQLVSLLPESADIIDIKAVRDFKDKIAFTEKEIEDWKIVGEPSGSGTQYKWDGEIAEEVEFDTSGRIHGVITNMLKELNDSKNLNVNLISLWDKFMEVDEDN